MLTGPRFSNYVVDFFPSEATSGASKESICLNADNDGDAIEQAKWLARRTVHHHYQVRAAAGNVHVVIYASAVAMVA